VVGISAERKLIVVAGTRPEVIKLYPVFKWLDRLGVDYCFVWSGQHFDYEMSKRFFKELGVPAPHIDLDIRSGSHAEQTAKIMLGLERVISKLKPNILAALGDTNTVLASALTSIKMMVPYAHIEAGLRSWSLVMPEEINRRVADAIASLHFAPTRLAAINLVFEGVSPRSIHITGNTIVDTLQEFKDLAAEFGQKMLGKLNLNPDGYILLTLHRAENVDSKRRLANILRAIHKLSEKHKIVFPVHPRTRNRIQAYGLSKYLENVVVTQPLGYLEFIGLLMHSSLVLTDSGGVQEEAFTLRIPTVTLRYNTERPETLMHGVNTLAGADTDVIIYKAEQQLARKDVIGKLNFENPLGDGRAGERIANVLKEKLENGMSIEDPDLREAIVMYRLLPFADNGIHAARGQGLEVIVVFDGQGNPDIPSDNVRGSALCRVKCPVRIVDTMLKLFTKDQKYTQTLSES
jgi:UDP-N-acetylglucosamine 2-epimerase (non-hydrolysing)